MTEDPLRAYVPRMLRGPRGASGPGHWQAEGTLVFADISGFTRLTEKLSRHGRIGAEEIVRTVSAIFTELLSATGDGGDVLKFSGDALLIFYEGDDHAQRACHAALTMRRRLREVGGIDSSAGRVRLRMAVGAHSGSFHFFLCGAQHLELYVLGEAASTTVAMEAAARAGQCLVSPATAAMVDARVVPQEGGVLVRAVPPLPAIDAPSVDDGHDHARFLAPPLRAHLAQSGGEHEHRRVAVAFAHFGEVDALLRSQGADDLFARVQELTLTAMTALAEYEVLLTATDVGADRGTLMLTAGAPDATGDEEARLLRVARRIVTADVGLPVRVGVNAGRVFVGAVGAPFRRTYSTMGAATNLAARVAARTAWGEVWATDEVVRHARGRFDTRPLQPFSVKGVAAPLRASVIGDALTARAGTDLAVVPLVGRAAELAALSAALERARGGRGEVVELVGEAGLGKSRLVAELHQRVGDIGWLGISCDPYEQTSAYRVARLLLRRALGIRQDESPETAGKLLTEFVADAAPALLPWLPLLAVPLGASVAPTPEANEVDPRYRRVRTQQIVCDLLASFVREPAVVVLEDAHHMDDASAELVAALFSRVLPTRPWLAVVTRVGATDGLHAGRGYRANELRLAPLDASAASTLAGRLAERTPVHAHLLGALVERAAGNPLFLTELVAAQAAGPEELPRSVEAIIAARIDGLAPEDRSALRYLSVLGDHFDEALLDAALGPLGIESRQPDRWTRLAPFVTRDAEGFAFRNALVRQVAYEGLPFGRRRDLHSRVADAIVRTSPTRVAQLPLHLIRAGRWAEGWSAGLAAAEDARAGAANAVAGELYDLALTAARHLDLPPADVTRAAVRAGEVWERAGVWERALRAYAQAAAVTQEEDASTQLVLRRAGVHKAAGRYPQALRLYRRALNAADDLPAGPPRARCRARARAGYASARLAQGRPDRAIEHATEAVVHAEEAPDRATLARAYHLLDRAHAALGDHSAAARYRDLALPVYAELGDLPAQGTVLHDLGADAHRAGRLEEALWLYSRGHEVRERAGDVVRTAASANAIGEVLLGLGQAEEAAARFTEALRLWRGARSPQGVVEATRNLGLGALRTGAAPEACRRLEEADDQAREIGSGTLLVRIHLPLAEALLGCGRFVEAWEAATRVLDADEELIAGRALAVARRLRAEALLRTNGAPRARAELEIARRIAAELDDGELLDAIERLLAQT